MHQPPPTIRPPQTLRQKFFFLFFSHYSCCHIECANIICLSNPVCVEQQRHHEDFSSAIARDAFRPAAVVAKVVHKSTVNVVVVVGVG